MDIGLKTFKFEQEFKSIDEFYRFMMNNIDFVENKVGIRIGAEGLIARPFCITGKEAVTERQILFYASENTLPENIGELIVLAGAFQADIVVFLVSRINVTLLEPMNWLHEICNEDIKFILGEVSYKPCLKSV
jgi:type II secretory pathway component PulL